MKSQEYEKMFALEKTHWWYLGLQDLISYYVKRKAKSKDIKILDAGCGTGGLLTCFQDFQIHGIDRSFKAVSYCRKRNLSRVEQASVLDIPFSENQFDIILCTDVLSYLENEEIKKALNEFYRILKKDGILLIHIPAYEFLRSHHDTDVETKHRFAKTEIEKYLAISGYRIDKMSFRVTLLFPLIAIRRLIQKILMKSYRRKESDLKPTFKWLNNLLRQILFLENTFIKKRSLPFGLSLFCIASKVQTEKT